MNNFHLLTSISLILLSLLVIVMAILGNLIQLLIFPLDFLLPQYSYPVHVFIANSIWTILQFGFERVNGIKITTSGEKLPENESAIVISNHLGAIDFLMIHFLARKSNMLGYCRYFIKYSALWIPFFGIGMYLMRFIFLSRDWKKDEGNLQKQFSALKELGAPIWLILFLEGTRISPSKLKKSHDFSKANNLPILNNVLTPRTKGFVETIKGLRKSQIKYVYDLTIAVRHPVKGYGAVPPVAQVLLVGNHGYECHVHTEKFCIDELPLTDQELEKWAQDRFQLKDRFLEDLKLKWNKE